MIFQLHPDDNNDTSTRFSEQTTSSHYRGEHHQSRSDAGTGEMGRLAPPPVPPLPPNITPPPPPNIINPSAPTPNIISPPATP